MKNYNSETPESQKDCAQTAEWFIKSLESLIGSEFDLDVCCLPETKKAYNYYSLADGSDGLKEPWMPVNFCNPPFSDIVPWLCKAKLEATLGNSTAILLPDNTETKYIRKATEYADTVIRMPFRLKFKRPDGSRLTS